MKKPSFAGVLSLCSAVLFVFCLAESTKVAAASAFYLKLCAVRVVPALFVFSVLCGVICSSPVFSRLCSLPLFGAEAAVLTMGLLGGFPLGASAALTLYENGSVTKRQAEYLAVVYRKLRRRRAGQQKEYLCAFSNNPSLSFTVSYAGGVLGSRRTGLLLAALTAASAALCALLLRYILLKGDERSFKGVSPQIRPKSFSAVLSSSCVSMLTVCGCIVFFGSISALFPDCIKGFFELSGGISGVKSPVFAAVLLGFSGLSVMLQVYAVCDGRLSVKPFLLSKLLQSALMGAAAYFIFD